MRLLERSLSELSRLEHQVMSAHNPDGTRTGVYVLRFRGDYGIGSRGNGDAALMRAVVMQTLAAWDASCLVLDLSELNYTWGDGLLGVLKAPGLLYDDPKGGLPFPVLIVVSDASMEGILTLLGLRDMRESDTLFRRLEDAVSAGQLRAQAWLNA